MTLAAIIDGDGSLQLPRGGPPWVFFPYQITFVMQDRNRLVDMIHSIRISSHYGMAPLVHLQHTEGIVIVAPSIFIQLGAHLAFSACDSGNEGGRSMILGSYYLE